MEGRRLISDQIREIEDAHLERLLTEFSEEVSGHSVAAVFAGRRSPPT